MPPLPGRGPHGEHQALVAAGSEILGGYLIRYFRLHGGKITVFSPENPAADFAEPGDDRDYLCYRNILANNREPLTVNLEDDEQPPDAEMKLTGCRSMVGFPTFLGETTKGYLCMYSRKPGEAPSRDVNFLGMLARALTIEEERLAHEESIKHFVDMASHELRTPLSIIKGYADAFLGGDLMELNEFQREKIRIINAKADKMTQTIEDLMNISRIDRGQFRVTKTETNLSSLVKETVRHLQEQNPERRFRIRLPRKPVHCPADAEKLENVVYILLDNAMKFSPPASEIELEVEPTDEGLLCSVLDRGPGIPERDRRRIFERFYQAEDFRYHAASGLGLGLYIAREIIRAHGGEIWHEPRPGGGSIFRFTLPSR
jgi:signal transduction histidine kinase